MPAAESLPPIVIVDDNATDVFLARRLLEEAKVKNPVFTFDDGSEAVAFLETVSRSPDSRLVPCVMFLDLDMARVDGFMVIARIRQRRELDGLRIVVLSGSPVGSSREERVLKAGADGFYTKFPSAEAIAKIVAGASGAD